MINTLSDREIVALFVAHLRDQGHTGLRIDRRPDEENRDSADIDAIAGDYAIEHTSVDTLENQRRGSAWFLEVVGGIESSLSPELKYGLYITLLYEGVKRGQDWSSVRDSFKSWIRNISPTLTPGRHHIATAPGIPFDFYADKSSTGRPGVIFSRSTPEDDTLTKRIRELLDRKSQKLKPYRLQGYTTLLLVESDDMALMNKGFMLEAIRTGFSNKLLDGSDQVWYADTAIPDDLLFSNFTELIKRT